MKPCGAAPFLQLAATVRAEDAESLEVRLLVPGTADELHNQAGKEEEEDQGKEKIVDQKHAGRTC